MPFQRQKPELKLLETERTMLKTISNSRTESKVRIQAASIMLTYADCPKPSRVAKLLKISRPTVDKWINKALKSGVTYALSDAPRSGRPPIITPEDRAWVVSTACQKPCELGYASELWTYSQLVSYIQTHCIEAGHPNLAKVTKSMVFEWLDKAPLQPHKISYYLERRDPDFEEKMAQVLCVYREVHLLETAADKDKHKIVTLSYDEKPGIQAIQNIAPDLPPVPGKHKSYSRDSEYKRLGTVSLPAGIDLHSGHILGLVRDRHRSREFVEFLEQTDQHYPKDWKIRIILDNHSAHTSKETQGYLLEHPNRFDFVFTPKHGSWLNLIEVFFSKMARSVLRHIRVQGIDELKTRIGNYLDEVNANPVVFRWKYKMDEAKV